MHQQAIIVTKDNASALAANILYFTAEDLLDECISIFAHNFTAVLVVEPSPDGLMYSHIVSESMFKANATTDFALNDRFYNEVTQLP